MSTTVVAASELHQTKRPTRRAFSDSLVALGHQKQDFWVLEADIGQSTYTHLFGTEFPDRYFNLGIAELGMVATAAGIAASGRQVVCSTYGVFMTMRALEAIRSFICYPNLDVKFLSSHGGITAAVDGVTHQATEDISCMSQIPNMKVLVPSDPLSAEAAARIALETPGPLFTRLMRDPLFDLYPSGTEFHLGGSHVVRPGRDVTLLSYGDILFQALIAAEDLAAEGVDAEVIDLYSIKPWDRETVLASAAKTGAVVVAENHQQKNGMGYEIAHALLTSSPVPFASLGLQDTFAESGAYQKLIEKYGISAGHIAEAARKVISRKG